MRPSQPTQPIATRPLAIQKDGTWYCYGWDLTKNICEIYSTTGYIRTVYTYTPYGEVTASGNVEQALQWSSEYFDSELSLSYYNFRYYNSHIGRWTTRDYISDGRQYMLYNYVANHPIDQNDILGLWFTGTHSSMTLTALKDYNFYFNVKDKTYQVPITSGILEAIKEGNRNLRSIKSHVARLLRAR